VVLVASCHALREEKGQKKEIGHGGRLVLYVCVFAAFRVRVSHAYGQLFENQL
jgi:hypothetical protein